jgi:DNA-binding GntR family transcriptional regulator
LISSENLRAAILGGEFKQGDHLHQAQLAERFGISRIPLRDALFRLEGEGLIEIDQRHNARVVRLGAADVREIYAIRILLEPVAARMSVEQLNDSDVMRLLHLCEVMDAHAHQPLEGQQSRRMFYDEFYRLSGSHRMHSVIMRMRDEITMYHLNHPWAADSHTHLREAIRAKDPIAAETFLRHHLESARDDLVTTLAASGEPEPVP